mmetsp:Transcript_42443/g.31093  ORF Transcript_42443/g.31093 Transcript_42443/m.31093 type:complete len:148 (+) Transcript_42443:398-841(+)
MFYDIFDDIVCTEFCPCDADPDLWGPEFNREKYNGMEPGKGVKDASDCLLKETALNALGFIMPDLKQDLIDAIYLATAGEIEFDCGGYCNISDFYMFSDISKGPPPRNCSYGSYKYIEDTFPKWAYICFLEAFLSIFGLIVSCKTCC